MCSLGVFPNNLWEAANSDARQRCGDILVSLDEPVSLTLSCIFCNFVVNDKLNVFWRHINEKHRSALTLKSLETAVKQEILLEVVHETYKTELVDDVAADPLRPEELKDDGLVIKDAGEILKIETETIVEKSLVEQPKDTEESETDNTIDDNDFDVNVKHFDCTNSKKSTRPTSHHICRIIELLEQQPTLWNTQLHTHYIRHERQEAVLNITNQMLAEFKDLTIDRRYVLNKVKHLKNLYFKYNKNIQYNYTKNDKQYYEMLHFLSAHAPPTTVDQKNYCILCKKSVSILTKHMVRFHQEGEKPKTCQICDALLPSERHLKMHMRSEHRRYECEYCDHAPYACAKGLRHHVSVVHPEQPPTLQQLADRTKNARAQSWPKERICEYCGRQFKAQKNLRAHKKTVHLQLRPYACTDCPKAFKTKDKLKSHMNSTHLNLREHSCDICAKAFFDRKTMVQHKRLHSDVKNYMCKVCNKAFRQAPALHSHMKTHR